MALFPLKNPGEIMVAWKSRSDMEELEPASRLHRDFLSMKIESPRNRLSRVVGNGSVPELSVGRNNP